MLKICAKCKNKKSIKLFYKNRSRDDGHDEYCKKCRSSYFARRKKESPEYKETVDRSKRSYRERHFDALQKRWKEYYAKNRERILESSRKHWLVKLYGISTQQYEQMIEDQKGTCAICSKPLVGRDLCVDHDHESGKVRGLLCRNCNTGLGCFRDTASLLKAAICYLKT